MSEKLQERDDIIISEDDKLKQHFKGKLADRPNAMTSYKEAKLSAEGVKELFDERFDFLIDRHNTLTRGVDEKIEEVALDAEDISLAETQRKNNEILREQAEEVRVENENQRIASENDRQATFEASESSRQATFEASESSRQATFEASESSRQATFEEAESVRADNEYWRGANETFRQEAERERVSREDLRQQNENVRESNESNRIMNDEARQEVIDGLEAQIEELRALIESGGGGGGGSGSGEAYPVGSIYISVNADTSPAELFGGTWEQLSDRYLKAVSTNYGATGGAEKHYYSLSGCYAYATFGTHPNDSSKNYFSAHTYDSASSISWLGYGDVGWSIDPADAPESDWDKSENITRKGIKVLGSTVNKDSQPPFLNVAMWKRIA